MVLLAARCVLAAVFGVAGAAKLADGPGSRKAVADFGAPALLVSPLALALPLAELAIAGLLLARTTARGAAFAAAALLCVFLAAIGWNLIRGRTPDCHCFGQLHSEPVGTKTLLRNGGLAAIAGLVAWRGAGDGFPHVRALDAVLLLVVGVALWAVYHLTRRYGVLLLRIEALESAGRVVMPPPPAAPAQPAEPQPRPGLPIGAVVDFQLPNLDGEEITASDFRGRRVVLVHWGPQCGFCNLIAPELAKLRPALRKQKTELVFVTYGDAETNRAHMAEYGLDAPVLLQQDGAIEAFHGLGTPSAYLVDEDGKVAKPLAIGANEVPTLVQEAARKPKKKTASLEVEPARAGMAAPAFALTDLDGEELSLASLRGRRVLLVFSDPQCHSCTELLPELVQIHREGGGPEIVLVGRGDAEANRAKADDAGVEFRYVLQDKWTVAEAYGTYATPAAFLVDERGIVARDVAFGSAGILELARAEALQPA